MQYFTSNKPINCMLYYIMNTSINISNETLNLGAVLYYYTSLALIPVFIFAFLINVFLLYVLWQDKAFQNITYKLIRISVISDALSSLTASIGYSLIAQDFPYRTGKIICQLIMYIVITFNGISMNNLCLIAIDRYFAIVKPFSTYYRRNRRRVFLIGQVISWTFSAGYNIILTPYIGGTHQDTTLCDIPDIDRYISIPIIIIVFCILQYIVPCTVLGFIYWRIIYHRKNYVRPGQNLNSQHIQEAKKKKINQILVTITLSYILTTWPYYAGIAGMAVTRQSVIAVRNKSPIVFMLLFCSLGTSIAITVVNPFIYLKFDANIRSKFIEILSGRKFRGQILSISSRTDALELSAATRRKYHHHVNISAYTSNFKLPFGKVAIQSTSHDPSIPRQLPNVDCPSTSMNTPNCRILEAQESIIPDGRN